MTGKQRAYLRGLANGIDAKYQIEKGGVDSNTIAMVEEALEANELIKIKVLENSMLEVREACGEICQKRLHSLEDGHSLRVLCHGGLRAGGPDRAAD